MRKTIGTLCLLGLSADALVTQAEQADVHRGIMMQQEEFETEAPKLPEGFVDNDHDGLG